MASLRPLVAVLGIAIAAGLVVVGGPAGRAHADDIASASEAAAVARIENGGWTQADLDLIRAKPELADITVDPTQEFEQSVDNVAATYISGGSANTMNTVAAPSAVIGSTTRCWYAQPTWKLKSLLHSTIYTWAHYVSWCVKDGKITKWQERFDWFPTHQSVVDVAELVTNVASSPGAPTAYSQFQRHVRLCAGPWCYANTYPTSKVTVGNGVYWAVGRSK